MIGIEKWGNPQQVSPFLIHVQLKWQKLNSTIKNQS
jgi:hypothetical protein